MKKELNREYLKFRLHNIWTTTSEMENKKVNLNKVNLSKILSLKNIHKNQRCFIIGGSPSLNLLDLSPLNNEYTFTVNRGYNLKEKGLLHSTYHIIQDKLLFFNDKIANEIPFDYMNYLILYAGIKIENKHIQNLIFYDYMHMINYEETEFQPDLTQKLVEGYSVIYTTLQIAAYMNFKDIYIIGVDLDFKNITGHSYKETEGEIERQKRSHLNQQRMQDYIAKAVIFLNKRNVNVYNASPTGKLNCMPRVKYEDLF